MVKLVLLPWQASLSPLISCRSASTNWRPFFLSFLPSFLLFLLSFLPSFPSFLAFPPSFPSFLPSFPPLLPPFLPPAAPSPSPPSPLRPLYPHPAAPGVSRLPPRPRQGRGSASALRRGRLSQVHGLRQSWWSLRFHTPQPHHARHLVIRMGVPCLMKLPWMRAWVCCCALSYKCRDCSGCRHVLDLKQTKVRVF